MLIFENCAAHVPTLAVSIWHWHSPVWNVCGTHTVPELTWWPRRSNSRRSWHLSLVWGSNVPTRPGCPRTHSEVKARLQLRQRPGLSLIFFHAQIYRCADWNYIQSLRPGGYKTILCIHWELISNYGYLFWKTTLIAKRWCDIIGTSVWCTLSGFKQR